MGPLSGYKVIEMASIGPIPMCGMLLADLGAEVIRVDRMQQVDLGLRRDPSYEFTSRGKRSVAIDLKTPEGVATVLKLTSQADVLIEGFRPGVMERIGLGPDVCFAVAPSLVFGRLTGWGQTGPLAQVVGHDMNFIGLTGVLDAIGSADGPPVPPLNLLGDLAGGSLFMAFGIAAALAAPGGRGRGQVIDLAITEGVASLMASIHGQSLSGSWPSDRGNHVLSGGAPWNTVYETKDGRFLAVCAIEQRFYDALLAKLELKPEALANRMDRAHWTALHGLFSGIFRMRRLDEWVSIFAGSDACVSPVLTVAEARQHPQALARSSFPTLNGKAQPVPVPRYNKTRSETKGELVLRPGQHTSEVLEEHGYSKAQVAALLANRVVL